MNLPFRILNVVGARPNLPKIAPLMREMSRYPEIDPILVHTGQHYDDTMSDIFFRQMEIPSPQVNLGVGAGSHALQTAEILKRIEPVLVNYKPHVVMVVGDVNSTIAVSLASVKLGIPVAHVEAGLRSFDRTMPEEINRVVTDTLSEYLFVTEKSAIDNLVKEGHPRKNIFLVGNVMIDSLRHFLPIAEKSNVCEELRLKNGAGCTQFAVLTLHRPSNVDSAEKLRQLLSAIDIVAEQMPVIFSVHPRTRRQLSDITIHHHPNVRMVSPFGYLDFLHLLSKAELVLTDSGGIQEETTALGVPCLTLRENTERPVTVLEGTNQLVGTDPQKIIAAVGDILAGKGKSGRVPHLWDGHAAGRIIQVLREKVPRCSPS